MKEKKPRTKARNQSAIPGYMCFSLNPNGLNSRASYTDGRREQVNEIRKLGACLRCQLLKKPCSNGNPCNRCLGLVAKNSASRCLSWMECVRPCLSKVSIFRSDPSMHEASLGGVPVLQYFADGNVQLKFDIPFQWNIDELSTFVASWLITDDTPKASMVGIMSSASLYMVLSDIIGPDLARDFKTLIYTTSLLFNSGELNNETKDEDVSYDIKVVHYCGQRILSHLDSQLRPTPLSKLTKHGLYATFLLLLGTIISSNYFGGEENEVLRSQSSNSRTADLIRLLSHYMVYIGQHSGLLSCNWEEGNASLALSQWNRRPSYTWRTDTVESYPQSGTASENSSQETLAVVADQEDHEEDKKPTLIDLGKVTSTPLRRKFFCTENPADVILDDFDAWDPSWRFATEEQEVQSRIEVELLKVLPPKQPESFVPNDNFNWPDWMDDMSTLDFDIPPPDPEMPSMSLSEPLTDMGGLGSHDDWPCLNVVPSPILASVELDPQNYDSRDTRKDSVHDSFPDSTVPTRCMYMPIRHMSDHNTKHEANQQQAKSNEDLPFLYPAVARVAAVQPHSRAQGDFFIETSFG